MTFRQISEDELLQELSSHPGNVVLSDIDGTILEGSARLCNEFTVRKIGNPKGLTYEQMEEMFDGGYLINDKELADHPQYDEIIRDLRISPEVHEGLTPIRGAAEALKQIVQANSGRGVFSLATARCERHFSPTVRDLKSGGFPPMPILMARRGSTYTEANRFKVNFFMKAYAHGAIGIIEDSTSILEMLIEAGFEGTVFLHRVSVDTPRVYSGKAGKTEVVQFDCFAEVARKITRLIS